MPSPGSRRDDRQVPPGDDRPCARKRHRPPPRCGPCSRSRSDIGRSVRQGTARCTARGCTILCSLVRHDGRHVTTGGSAVSAGRWTGTNPSEWGWIPPSDTTESGRKRWSAGVPRGGKVGARRPLSAICQQAVLVLAVSPPSCLDRARRSVLRHRILKPCVSKEANLEPMGAPQARTAVQRGSLASREEDRSGQVAAVGHKVEEPPQLV
jgi:hypothetical protein